MTRQETRNFLERIHSHYNDFIVDDFKIADWYNELKKYDLHDVSDKFEKHIKSEEYGKYAPKLFNLTRYLTPVDEKGKQKNYIKECPKCGAIFSNETFDDHYNDCVLISSIIRDMKKYFNMELSRKDLESFDKPKLYKAYNKYINMMLASELVSNDRKEVLKKCYIQGY